MAAGHRVGSWPRTTHVQARTEEDSVVTDHRGQGRDRGAGQVRVTVNGRSYKIGCDAGEEERILDLAQYLDGRVADLAGRVGQVGDERLLLMTALVLADDLAEAVAELETLRQAPSPEKAVEPPAQADLVRDLLADPVLQSAPERLERVALQIEDIAARAARP